MTSYPNQTSIYQIKVEGESESDWRAATPENIENLLDGTNQDHSKLEFKIVSAEVELLIGQGETLKATEVLQAYVAKVKKPYSAPINRFRKDSLNGGFPFLGAHSYFGALRDALDALNPDFFYQDGKKNQKGKPSKKHLRKFIKILPHHVYFYQLDGQVIKKPFETLEGQQPVGPVKGFAYYEIIRHPFKVSYKLQINPNNKQFGVLLSDPNKIIEAIHQSAWYGQGGSRGAGYGQWKVTKAELV